MDDLSKNSICDILALISVCLLYKVAGGKIHNSTTNTNISAATKSVSGLLVQCIISHNFLQLSVTK